MKTTTKKDILFTLDNFVRRFRTAELDKDKESIDKLTFNYICDIGKAYKLNPFKRRWLVDYYIEKKREKLL